MTPEAENDRVGDLLTRSLPPGPDPDAARLAALRAASVAAFADSPPTSPRRTRPMTHLLRLAAGLVAAGVAIFAVLHVASPSPDPVWAALGELTSGGAHFRLVEGGRAQDAYIKFPDAIRIEDDAERYTLLESRGGEAYAVDEAADRKSVV